MFKNVAEEDETVKKQIAYFTILIKIGKETIGSLLQIKEAQIVERMKTSMLYTQSWTTAKSHTSVEESFSSTSSEKISMNHYATKCVITAEVV